MFLNLDETAYNFSPYPRDTCYVNSVFEIESKNDSKLLVYPNPNNGTFSISLNTSIGGNGILSIIDLSGKIIYQQQINSTPGNEFEVKTSMLHAGVYVVQVDINGTLFRDKLIIQ